MSCFQSLFSLPQCVPLIVPERSYVVGTRPHTVQSTPWMSPSVLSGVAADFCMTLKTSRTVYAWTYGDHVQSATPELSKTRGRAVTSASPKGLQPELECARATTTKHCLREKLLVSLSFRFSTADFKTLFSDYQDLYVYYFFSLPRLIFCPDGFSLSLFAVCLLLCVDQDHLLLS